MINKNVHMNAFKTYKRKEKILFQNLKNLNVNNPSLMMCICYQDMLVCDKNCLEEGRSEYYNVLSITIERSINHQKKEKCQ
ncbi:hypothetical protein BpHYR1_045829 [Brachionus plicatilis]|uniref:Uncharacterized protein n=1 Tax=Brachionus plicatilis TaxID=10195 RepID=A0A3M7RQU7_BRAPC|nr:hypothetical protein BpHYR1_045829 [Brachionus plicatilis]